MFHWYEVQTNLSVNCDNNESYYKVTVIMHRFWFTELQTSICGNGVVEPGEECDCGWEEDCKDACCFPQRRYSSPEEPPCRLTPNSICSPSQVNIFYSLLKFSNSIFENSNTLRCLKYGGELLLKFIIIYIDIKCIIIYIV